MEDFYELIKLFYTQKSMKLTLLWETLTLKLKTLILTR